MKTLNYIDPIVSPGILPDRPHHHTRFDNHGRSFSLKSSKVPESEKRFIVKHAKGSRITDTRGNEYIDFNLSQGANILGHAPAIVLRSTEDALRDGINHGMPTLAESLLQKSIQEAVPSIEKVKLLNSGAEAVKGAIRLAKAFTGKDKILVIEGRNARLANSMANTLPILPFNNVDAVLELFSMQKKEIAAIFVEPVCTNNGVILPDPGNLQFLKEITSASGSLLIFDETSTGFRPKLSGAQGYFGITPDLTIFGKIAGGGFSIGAVGGKHEIVTSSAFQNPDELPNPITAVSGLVTLKRLSSPLFYETLNHRSRDFIHYLTEITRHKDIVVNSFQSMFSLHFIDNGQNVQNYNVKRFELFHKNLMEKGVYLSPSPFETNYISIAHLPEDLNKTLEVMYSVLKK